MAGELSIENGFPVGAEGFDEDVLNWLGVLVMSVELAAALSLAEVDPVGGTIAGALEARGFAEGLEQHGADAIVVAASARAVGAGGRRADAMPDRGGESRAG